MKDIQRQLIENALFAGQIYDTFTDNAAQSRAVYIEPNSQSIVKAFHNIPVDLKVCHLVKWGSTFSYEKSNKVLFLLNMRKSFPLTIEQQPSLISNEVTQQLLEDKDIRLDNRMELFYSLDFQTRNSFDLEHLADILCDQSDCSADYAAIADLLEMTEYGQLLLDSEGMRMYVENAISSEIDDAETEEDCNAIEDSVFSLSLSMPGLNYSKWQEEIELAKCRIEEMQEPEENSWNDNSYSCSQAYHGDDNYCELFSSLLSIE